MNSDRNELSLAVLFAADGGPYVGLTGVEAWTEAWDARLYPGPFPVIAHPPCERWGRYWSGGPSAKTKRKLGDDSGCFEFALNAVKKYGGVLEHPEASHAWAKFHLLRPNPSGGWTWDEKNLGWVCQVEQGHYGHPARKKTWLFLKPKPYLDYFQWEKPPELKWGPSSGRRLDEGFHSKEERKRARASGQKPIARLSKQENIVTPVKFRDALLGLLIENSLRTSLAEEKK